MILDNADNAYMHAPENRVALIYNDWGDHRVGADIISYMNGYKDPRRAVMFTQGTWNKKTDYYGMRIGTDPTNKSAMVSTYSNQIVDSKSPYLWMNAAEVTFLRAEGALRNWAMQGDAKDLYETAIRLSFEERGATGADTYLTDAVSTPQKYTDPMGNYSMQAPGQYDHDRLGSRRYGCRQGAQSGTHHYPEVDCYFPTGHRGLVGSIAARLSQTAACCGKQECRHSECQIRSPPHSLSFGGIYRKSRSSTRGRFDAQRSSGQCRNARVVGCETFRISRYEKNK